MTFTSTDYQTTVEAIAASFPTSILVYTGVTEVTTTQILNKNNSTPRVKPISVENLNQIGLSRRTAEGVLNSAFAITEEIYRVSLTSDTEPDDRLQWWISKDNGTTKQRVKVAKIDIRNLGFYWIFLALSA